MLQVCDRLMQHSFRAIRDRPVEAGEGAEVGDITQVGLKEPDLRLLFKDEDGYYVGSVPALPGCHTQRTSIDQLLERMQEAVILWLESDRES